MTILQFPSTGVKRASKGAPCPVCDHDHSCSETTDGLIRCRHRHGSVPGFEFLGLDKKSGEWGLYRREGDVRIGRQPPPPRREGAKPVTRDWGAEHSKDRGFLTPERRLALAEALGLPEYALELLEVGYKDPGPHRDPDTRGPSGPCWTFPERDGTGVIVGLTRRYPGGQKKAIFGSARGLTIPNGWAGRDGPVLLPEGASCTATLTAMGLPAVGRPSNQGGVPQLAELLRGVPTDREIIVLGENDRKENGNWPGRDGAEQTAARLQSDLGRPVLWALPPGNAKDMRAWATSRVSDRESRDEWSELRDTLLAALEPQPAPATGATQGRRSGSCAPDGGAQLTDVGNARRLIDRHGTDLRYCHAWRCWLVWDGRRWRKDRNCQIVEKAKDTLAALLRETNDRLADVTNRMRDAGPDERQALKEEDRQAQAIRRWYMRSHDAPHIHAMIDLAQSDPSILVEPDRLDRHPYLFNVLNGTLDLRTGQLGEHRREDFLTKMCPVQYDPSATAPRWESFLGQIFAGRPALIAYARRLAGYFLTGDVSEQVLPIFHGTGANGKSTMMIALMELMGPEYAIKAAPDLLMSKTNTHPTERADLFGMRLVVANETEDGQRLAESLAKDLTGGDRIRARRMHEDFWEFSPTHKLVLVTNHKPRIRGLDHAIWRRVHLVPFEVTIDERDQDRHLLEALRAELPGILAWAVRGCREWGVTGLDMPEEVRVATASYRNEQDMVGAFIAECCVAGPEYRCKAYDLYERFKRWCKDTGEAESSVVPSQRKFGQALGGHRYESYTSNGTWYRGLRLRDDQDVGNAA